MKLGGESFARNGRRPESYAPFYAAVQCIVPLAIAFYRIRATCLLKGIWGDAAVAAKILSYWQAAVPADFVALVLGLAFFRAVWRLSPVLGGLGAAASLLVAAAFSGLMAFSSEFLRVYQTAFAPGYVGLEHFTGLGSMLGSAASEITPPTWIGLAALLGYLAIASGAALRRAAFAPGPRRSFSELSLSASLPLALAACILSASLAKPDQEGEEAGRNPLVALLRGPESETYEPPPPRWATASAYDTDSLENPAGLRQPPEAARGRHNVILYFFESTSWRYFDLEVSGHPVLPAMRRLAAEGLLLKNHYSNYPLSANTLYSVLGSRYSMYGKSMIFGEYHDADVRTLPEVLASAGYDSCFIHTGDLLYAARDKFLANRGIGEFILYDDFARDPGFKGKVGWGADERLMADRAADWIRRAKRPYFLMVAPVSPHHPYAIPSDFQRIADPDEPGIGEGERNWRDYLNSLHYADAALGILIQGLEDAGLMEDTVLVLVADHGEAFYQHRGNYNHPLFVYEENVHVPALFYGKGIIEPGGAMESVTRHIDILPSILDLLGLEDGIVRDGESIFSLAREKMAVVHTSWNDEYMAVRDGKWKYIERMKDGREELYDLDADPGEKNNVAGANPLIVGRYRVVVDDSVSYMLEEARNLGRIAPRP